MKNREIGGVWRTHRRGEKHKFEITKPKIKRPAGKSENTETGLNEEVLEVAGLNASMIQLRAFVKKFVNFP
jgi:hypothetical protein